KAEGIDQIFESAGFMLREPGCSACLGMNEDKIPAGKYCVSTSNRNFEGREGPNARTMLVSPLTAAAAAITGKVEDVRELSKTSYRMCQVCQATPITENKVIDRSKQNASSIFNERTLGNDYNTLKSALKPGLRVLDIGCGTGSITKDIANLVGP